MNRSCLHHHLVIPASKTILASRNYLMRFLRIVPMSGHLQGARTSSVAQVINYNTDRSPSRRRGPRGRVIDRGELDVGATGERRGARETHVLGDENGARPVGERASASLHRGVDVVAGAAVPGDGDGALDGDAGDGLSQADGAAKVERLQVEAGDAGALIESGDGRDTLDLGDDVGDGVAVEAFG